MKFRPLHDRVVIRSIDEDEWTPGGVIIPDTAMEKPMKGEVIAVGPGARNDQSRIVAPDIRPGDRVLFGRWAGTDVTLNGQDLLIMKEADILGVIDRAGAANKAA